MFKLAWLLLTNKKFRYLFQGVYDYALSNWSEKRGDHASDVCIFVHEGWDHKLTEEVEVLEWHEKLKTTKGK